MREADTIVVFTDFSREEILAQGGSGDWVLNPQRASVCTYLVCCRKPHPRTRLENVPEHAAFLIGRIRDVRKRDEEKNKRGQSRYFIELDEYAEIQKPGVWSKDKRNPVLYSTLHELSIDPANLRFKPVPDFPKKGQAEKAPRKLTINEAKRALAASYGVKPNQIEIIIKG